MTYVDNGMAAHREAEFYLREGRFACMGGRSSTTTVTINGPTSSSTASHRISRLPLHIDSQELSPSASDGLVRRELLTGPRRMETRLHGMLPLEERRAPPVVLTSPLEPAVELAPPRERNPFEESQRLASLQRSPTGPTAGPARPTGDAQRLPPIRDVLAGISERSLSSATPLTSTGVPGFANATSAREQAHNRNMSWPNERLPSDRPSESQPRPIDLVRLDEFEIGSGNRTRQSSSSHSSVTCNPSSPPSYVLDSAAPQSPQRYTHNRNASWPAEPLSDGQRSVLIQPEYSMSRDDRNRQSSAIYVSNGPQSASTTSTGPFHDSSSRYLYPGTPRFVPPWEAFRDSRGAPRVLPPLSHEHGMRTQSYSGPARTHQEDYAVQAPTGMHPQDGLTEGYRDAFYIQRSAHAGPIPLNQHGQPIQGYPQEWFASPGGVGQVVGAANGPGGNSQQHHDSRARKRRGNLPKDIIEYLTSWLRKNLQYPYPNEEMKKHFEQQTGLEASQISNWFINSRRRTVPRLLAEERIREHKEQARAKAGIPDPHTNSDSGAGTKRGRLHSQDSCDEDDFVDDDYSRGNKKRRRHH